MRKPLLVLLLCLSVVFTACPGEPPDTGGQWNSSNWNQTTWK
jgi:hypothetical protein